MSTKIMALAGAFLMALCGGLVGRHIGQNDSILMAGFAIGVIWAGQYPAIALRKRVDEVERQLAELNETRHNPYEAPPRQ